MASNIVDRASEDKGVRIGNDQVASMQLIQAIYNELTGKSEKLSKVFRTDHKTTYQDICQLNTKITQLYEQYNIVAQTCTVTLYHVDDGKEQFSSFDRFKLFDGSSLSPIENIRLKYNFVIILPKTDRPQSYDIEIDIHSRAAIHRRTKNETGLQQRFLFTLASSTGQVDIEYVDYTVARNFLIAVEHWFQSLAQTKSSSLLGFVKRYSGHLPFIFRNVSAVVIATYFLLDHARWVSTSSTLSSLFAAGILCFSIIVVAPSIALYIGQGVRDSIERTQPVSYLKLNRGDEQAIQELESSNRKNLKKSVAGFALVVATDLFSAWLATQFGIGG